MEPNQCSVHFSSPRPNYPTCIHNNQLYLISRLSFGAGYSADELLFGRAERVGEGVQGNVGVVGV